jgi:phosphocarrier protein HPr
MPERNVMVASAVGLHARPAALFVKAANATGLPVRIARRGQDSVDARSILAVMALGVQCGEEIAVSTEGDGAEAALDSLVALLERDLDGKQQL